VDREEEEEGNGTAHTWEVSWDEKP